MSSLSTFKADQLAKRLEKLQNKLDDEKKDELPPIPDKMSEFAKQYRYIRKKPFSFDYVDEKKGTIIPEARSYLYEPYDTDANRLLFVKGRQMEISELATNIVLYHALKYPDCTILYTCPRDAQVGRFSKLRLKKWGILDSPLLRPLLTNEPSVHEINLMRSTVYLYSAWNDADAIRNIAADVAICDEFQDMAKDTLPVIESALSHSSIDKIYAIGTPKDAGSDFERLWRLSSQKEWNTEKKEWIAKQPADPWEGYHISQRLAPWIGEKKIEHYRRTYTPMRFENEVLGQFFKGAGRPLTADDMQSITDISLGFIDEAEPTRIIYAGSDWGTGSRANTIFWAMEVFEKHPEPPSFILRYLENVSLSAVDPIAEVKRISELIDRFSVKRLVADIGFGNVQVNELKKQFGDRVMGCVYLGNVKEPIKYRNTALGALVEVDRTVYIDKAVDVVKRKRLTIPGRDQEKKEQIWDEFTCLYLETEESTQGRRYRRWLHDSGSRDDIFMSFNYALIAYEIDSPYRNASNDVVSFGERSSFVEFGDDF